MKIWRTKSGYEIFRVLSGRSNSYLISAKGKNILVDTGKESAFKKLESGINSLPLTGNKLSFLILTHTHFDHCQNAAKIKEREKCIVVVSKKAYESINDGFTKLPEGVFLITKIISKLGSFIGKKRFGYTSFNGDILIDDEFEFSDYDLKLKLIQTAGHSSDSISILVDGEVAIVGDVLFGIFRNSILPPYAENLNEMIESWEKLLNTTCKVFLPGHGREIQRKLLQKEYNKYKNKFRIKERLDKPAIKS